MNEYMEMRDRQQKEFNALPLGFAFGQKQFDEMMRGWGLDPEKDTGKIYSIGAGGYIQKKDVELLRQTSKRHKEEMEAAIAGGKTGEGFIYQMFLCELDNHEYGYTGDTSDTLEALGYTAEQVLESPCLKRGIEKAVTEIYGREAS